MKVHLPSAEFAFLAACHSGASGKETLDEGISLAGTMQFCGFKSVVGALWEMDDAEGPKLAMDFCEYLWKKKKVLDVTQTAAALHYAIRMMRARNVPIERWANIVHFGI